MPLRFGAFWRLESATFRRGGPARLVPVDIQWTTTNSSSFQPRSAHSSLHALPKQVSFELRDRADDNNHRSAQWPASVDVLAQADELNAEVIQFIDDLQEMANTSGEPVKGRYQHGCTEPRASWCDFLAILRGKRVRPARACNECAKKRAHIGERESSEAVCFQILKKWRARGDSNSRPSGS
jgi:hypothetical protein